jgi:hypothetical protein
VAVEIGRPGELIDAPVPARAGAFVSGKLMGAVYERDLPPHLQAIVLAFVDHVNHKRGDNRSWPGVDKVAWKLGLHWRTVQRGIRKLEALGVMKEVEKASRYKPAVYEIDLDAVPRKGEFKPRKREQQLGSKGDAGATLKDDAKGGTEGLQRRHRRSTKGDAGVPPRATPVPPEPEVTVNGNRKGIGRLTSLDFDEEEFFEEKKRKIRAECEAEARKGSVWHAAILDGLDREAQH